MRTDGWSTNRMPETACSMWELYNSLISWVLREARWSSRYTPYHKLALDFPLLDGMLVLPGRFRDLH